MRMANANLLHRASIARIWAGLRALDEALHHDPAEALHVRLKELEGRVQRLEFNRCAAPDDTLAKTSPQSIEGK